jgi:hypothetical protein
VTDSEEKINFSDAAIADRPPEFLTDIVSSKTKTPPKKKRRSLRQEERLFISHLFLSSSSLAGLLVLAPEYRLPGFIGPVPPPLSIRVFF